MYLFAYLLTLFVFVRVRGQLVIDIPVISIYIYTYTSDLPTYRRVAIENVGWFHFVKETGSLILNGTMGAGKHMLSLVC